MRTKKDILIVGVGGQGVLLASELLSTVAMHAGYDVKKSEVHGMAQRGGVVSSHVRISRKVYSPLIKRGEVDVILAFESAEALRWLHFLRQDGIVIINTLALIPPIASLKEFVYPSNPISLLKESGKKVKVIDASTLAKGLGNIRLVNTILLGILSLSLDISVDIWEDCILRNVPKGTEALNQEAFSVGRTKGKE